MIYYVFSGIAVAFVGFAGLSGVIQKKRGERRLEKELTGQATSMVSAQIRRA